MSVTPTNTVRPPLVLTALLIAVASFQLNATMLAPAITSISTELNTTPTVVGLSSTVFLFMAAIAGIVLPPLSDIIGRRRALVYSISVMAAGSLIATIAVNVPMLMIGRALQGACGATISLSILMLRDLLNKRQFGKYLGILTAVNSGVGGVDTLLGGIIADTLGFRGIFALTLVLELLAIVLIRLWTPESDAVVGSRMDWPGTITLALALLAINGGLTLAFGEAGWTHGYTWACLGAGAILLITFGLIENRVKQPLLPMKVLRQRGVWGLLATTFFTMSSSFAVLLFLIPAWSQDVNVGFGMNGTVSALLFLLPFSLLGWAVAPFAGHFAPRVGYRLVLRIGLAGSAALILGLIAGIEHQWVAFVLVFLMGATYSAASATALNGLGIIYAPASKPGILPGLNSTMFNFGASIGIGMLAATIAATPDTAGFKQALIVAGVLAVIALSVSFALPAKQVEGERV
ncbi:MFS transporter [Lysinibacter sp. HNR]|uniref:MFS transporter n=1 Tax=Lysinibacter sp. HNR TaxID=3031408 RepID=UPI002434D7AE|nr:MFS transporter [Lysinibacter sp. HNR]WGD37760.1 MFS transporter [Lysinibacter sp. HNR]